jgi:hypothetical protein
MASDVLVGGVIEPTVPVSNGLLEVARRLSADLGPVSADLSWVPPHRYVAPLAFGSPGDVPPDDAPVEVLRALARDLEEFGVQLAPPSLVIDGPGSARIVAVVTSKGDELATAVRMVSDRLREVGVDVRTPEPVSFTLALLTGEATVQAVQAAFPAVRETPLAGWLVGGLCVHAGPTTHEGRGWAPTRLRYVALRRLGSRRSGS